MIAATTRQIAAGNAAPVIFSADKQLDMIGAAAVILGPKKDRKNAPEVAAFPKGAQVIVVSLAAKAALTKKELAAVLLHERGHIALGHVKHINTMQLTGIPVDVNRIEMEADQYAIQQGACPKALASAIKKITALIFHGGAYADYMEQASGKRPNKRQIDATMKSASLINKPRFAVLEAA